MFALRAATLDDLPLILPRTKALNAQEGIAISDELLEAALRRLLTDTSLGGVWVIREPPPAPATGEAIVGHAIVTFGYDLEFGGRDAYLTELWIDEAARGKGAGSDALAALPGVLRAHDVRALHLQVRPDNPAIRLYDRAGFVRSPRVVMTKRF
jgi:ribosomal protein S18 acetylase RimI-like enzyme